MDESSVGEVFLPFFLFVCFLFCLVIVCLSFMMDWCIVRDVYVCLYVSMYVRVCRSYFTSFTGKDATIQPCPCNHLSSSDFCYFVCLSGLQLHFGGLCSRQKLMAKEKERKFGRNDKAKDIHIHIHRQMSNGGWKRGEEKLVDMYLLRQSLRSCVPHDQLN